jgi:hypothetical protein
MRLAGLIGARITGGTLLIYPSSVSLLYPWLVVRRVTEIRSVSYNVLSIASFGHVGWLKATMKFNFISLRSVTLSLVPDL